MINGTNVVVAGGIFNINMDQRREESQTATEYILQNFGKNYVPCATHDNDDILDPPKCHPGTRTSFLTHLSNWVQDTKSSVYLTWLHGPAGAGKSAIARSLAESLDGNSLLAGSFFFFRSDPRRNSSKPFVMTLAYQISRSITDARTYIANAVKDDPTVISMSLETQFKTLITEPLVQITADKSRSLRPMLIIIDGLDECAEQYARNLILEVIFDACISLHGLIKFLIISRPEYDIQRSFDSAGTKLGSYINTIGLQGDLEAYDDVRKYICDNFRKIKETHPLKDHFPPNWPSGHAIEQLVEKSSGHFIYASTVIKYIENDFDQPQERLETIVKLRTTSHNPYAALDALYLNILKSSRAGVALLVNILSIVVLDIRFNTNDIGPMNLVCFIESVLLLQNGAVQHALLDLRSLVGVKKTIEFWHKSFSDFLLDPTRSNEFYTSSASACALIAKGCLHLLSDETDLLERSWSKSSSYPTRTLQCHHLLCLCCAKAIVDPDLEAAMMEYDFNIMPPHIDLIDPYISVFFSCLRSYQQSPIFEGTKVVEHLWNQFDRHLLSELERFVPLDSELMDVLRGTISPRFIDRQTYQKLARKGTQMVDINAYILHYMYSISGDGDVIISEFFYSRRRAGKYYLGADKPLPSRPILDEAPPEPPFPTWGTIFSFFSRRSKSKNKG